MTYAPDVAGGKNAYSQDRKSNIALYDFLATGFVPEPFIRWGIKRMLGQKLAALHCSDPQVQMDNTSEFIRELKRAPIAIATASANQQHYEVPSDFFSRVLGPNMKYSSCLWEDGDDLEGAELRMLQLTCERAQIADGQTILDLGCGWGSFTLFAARKFPKSRITAISNSNSQRLFIEERVAELKLKNVLVLTADINDFAPEVQFDRIVSVEMFEHAKNYELLMSRISSWLSVRGKLFVHIFTHAKYHYHFDSEDESDWLTKYFFTGGTMPSDNLLLYFQRDMLLLQHWCVNGTHYQKTAEAWLQNMQSNRQAIMEIISETYGSEQSKRWWVYWRLFFLACSELWGFEHGSQWMVSHYLFEKRL